MKLRSNYFRSTDQILSLSRSLLDDVFKDFNSTSRRWLRRVMEPFVYPSAKRFARLATRFDHYVGQFGFHEGMQRILPFLIYDLKVSGVKHVPEEGPLLVVSNHPGTFDSVAIAATLPRSDLNIIASGFPILRKLPFASRHLIFVSTDMKARMMAVRSAIRHLQDGGSVLLFPSGRVDPDPACLPGAPEAMSSWSSSIELFLKKVPHAKVLPTIVSGVLSPKYLASPLIRFWRGIRDPQATAEVIQVIVQMLFPQKVRLAPRISFGVARTMEELNSLCAEGKDALTSIVDEARRLLSDHLVWIDNIVEPENILCE